MKVMKLKNKTANKFIEETLNLIDEKGSAVHVNLREVAKKVGCAHTNAYNYFNGFDGLLSVALEEAMLRYANALIKDLDDDLSACEYFEKFFLNYINFILTNTGIYRFVASDNFVKDLLNENHLEIVGKLKNFADEMIFEITKLNLNKEEAVRLSDILLAYFDGETFNLINDRILPGEDIKERIIDNLHLILSSITIKNGSGVDLKKGRNIPEELKFPKLKF